jgi:dihydrolipoamide dehydrogenase
MATGKETTVTSEEVMVAAGRGPTTGILHAELAGIKTTKEGWIEVNDYLETSQPGIWAFGDALGRHMFKHVANYESILVYENAVLKKHTKVDYHAVPNAVFTYPEIASVGMKESEALKEVGEDGILIGFYKYENTAKGEAINARGYFVKVILEKESLRILGAHIIGPNASILIQEIVNLMYTKTQDARPLMDSMHIHPSMSEVVDRAFSSLMEPSEYHHFLQHERRPD